MIRLNARIMMMFFISSVALSQDNGKNPPPNAEATKVSASENLRYKNAIISEFESKIDKVLSQVIKRSDYSLKVSVELNQQSKAVPLPYMPSFGGTTIATEINESVTSVDAIIFINNNYVGNTTTSLKNLLELNLGLGNKLKLDFKTFEISKRGGDNPEVQKINDDLRSTQSEKEQLERERNDLKRELTSLEASAGYKDYAIAGAIILALSLLAFALLQFASKMQSAISTIASSIEAAGTNLSNSLAPDDTLSASMNAGPALEASTNSLSSGGGESISETQYEQLIRLREEISPAINPDNMSIVIQYVTSLISTKNQAATAVLTMELLGEKIANEIYNSLSQESQMTVYKFLKEGEYGGEKAKLMLEAGELLKTKLIGEKMGKDQNHLDEQIVLEILNFSEKDINTLVSEMTLDHFSRLFHYLSSAQTTSALQYLKYHDEGKYKRALESLQNVPENEKSPTGDKSIVEAITAVKDKNSENAHRIYLPLYKDIIEQLPDDQAEDFISVFAEGYDQVRKYFSENIITFNTVFNLNDEYISELFTRMTNREVAALFFNIGEEKVTYIKPHISERRLDLIDEELERFEAMTKRVAQQYFVDARNKAIALVKEMKGNLPIAELTESASPSSEQSAEETNDSESNLEGAA